VAQAIVEPGERFRLDTATEAREAEAQIALVPRQGTDRKARGIERRIHVPGAGSHRRAIQPGLDHFAEVQVDPGPFGLAPEGWRQPAARRAQEDPAALTPAAWLR